MRLLLVEDQPDAARLIAKGLREPRAFLRYYDALASSSSVVVATASRAIEVARGAF